MAANILIGNAREQHGFTYMGLLMVLAISSIAMAGLGIVWHQDMQREREKELKFIGAAYRKAIGSYYESQVNASKKFPEKLQDLVLDERFPTIKRHIRALYTDPMRHNEPWGLVLQEGRIVGVYSLSNEKMIQQAALNVNQTESVKYSDLKFIYVPVAPVTTPTTKAPESTNPSETANPAETNPLHVQIPETLNHVQSINGKPATE